MEPSERVESGDPGEDVVRQLLDQGVLLEPQRGAILRTGQFSWEQEEFEGQFLERVALPVFWQAGALEGRHQVRFSALRKNLIEFGASWIHSCRIP